MALKRKLLAQALNNNYRDKTIYGSDESNERSLQDAQDIQDMSVNPNYFGNGAGREVGLGAQIGTALVGAYARRKAENNIAEKEKASQNAFAEKYPQYAELASQLSPATRNAFALKSFENDLNKNDPQKQLERQKIQAEIGKLNAETNKANREGRAGFVNPEQQFKNTTALRSDYLNNSKNFQDVKNGHERVIASSKDPSPAGDLSLIYSYMKTLDPGSTVREGEFATAQQAGSLPQNLIAKYNKVISGERLAPDQRKDFVDRSTRLYDQANRSQQKIVDQYSSIAKRNGLNPEDVVVDFSTTLPPDQNNAVQPANAQNQQVAQSQSSSQNQNMTPIPANIPWRFVK